MKALLWVAVAAALVGALLVGTGRGRDALRAAKAQAAWWSAARGTVRSAHAIDVEGAVLATDLYRPAGAEGPLPTILLRLPYGKRRFGEARWWLEQFGRDHAVVIQDMRGRHGSTGAFEPWRHEGKDGAATLDWIAAQDWSNGRVGTAGCSALGETQVALAMERHPAHAAMIALGAGGGVGEMDGRRAPFAAFEGGIPALALGAGWFGGEVPGSVADLSAATARDAVRGPGAAGWHALLDGFEDPGFAARMGYADGAARFATPALIVDGWFDAAAAQSLSLTAAMRAQGVAARALILPATHCDFEGGFAAGAVGDVPVNGAAPDLGALFRSFMAAHLSGAPEPDLPPYRLWAMGADAWVDAEVWPPAADPVVLHLDGETLGPAPNAATRAFVSDPADPVPSIGGAVCCTAAVAAGPRDQTPIEGRADLLAWTSDPVPGTILGTPEVTLRVSADASDADLIVRLTEVAGGRSVTIAEGALRLRYRTGWTAPEPLPEGPVEVTIPLSPIAWRLAEGARLRLHVAGTSVPRLAPSEARGGAAVRITVLGGRVAVPMARRGPAD